MNALVFDGGGSPTPGRAQPYLGHDAKWLFSMLRVYRVFPHQPVPILRAISGEEVLRRPFLLILVSEGTTPRENERGRGDLTSLTVGSLSIRGGVANLFSVSSADAVQQKLMAVLFPDLLTRGGSFARQKVL